MSLFIGLDLGGTNLKYALGTGNGDLLIRFSKPSMAFAKQDKIFENMFSAVDQLIEVAASRGETVVAIGIGSPGCVDFETGQLLGSTPNFVDWTNAPIKKRFEERFHVPTWVDNDANMMALAESRKGAGRGYRSVLCATLGTGIGGGMVINGELYRGSHYSAAEIGHIVIEIDGRPCNCGNRGCLEAYAAAPAIVDRYRKKLKRFGVMFDIEGLNTETIFLKAQLNEDLAKETILETCDYLGTGLASVANVIDPDLIILGGGVAEAGNEFIQRIEQAVKQNAIGAIAEKIRVVKAMLNVDAGIIGAILLAAENYAASHSKPRKL
ncbi:MAG: ROK family protein [candidate division KSB1 bacterium]|nr:ROK family protein [candidate division KSB1 bacterium]MDZ7334991.1 ROK family protein [candidate division KSB1 bacterium]MDZ7357132.1 ROK family protein [candidate division KSB1 bacterium]MDZ7400200.1 ROK family protein [candidate division KSB1 bacterium]